MSESVEACSPDAELRKEWLEDAPADVVAGDRRACAREKQPAAAAYGAMLGRTPLIHTITKRPA
jgi:hypothetical protein